MVQSIPSLSSAQKTKLCAEIAKGSPSCWAKAIVNVPQVKKCVQVVLLNDIDEQCRKLCARAISSLCI